MLSGEEPSSSCEPSSREQASMSSKGEKDLKQSTGRQQYTNSIISNDCHDIFCYINQVFNSHLL